MNSINKRKLNLSVISFVLLGLILLNCGGSKENTLPVEVLKSKKASLEKTIDSLNNELTGVNKALKKLDPAEKINTITTKKPLLTDFNHYIEAQGLVKANNSIELRPETSGTITKIHITQGQSVTKGQLLISLDNSVILNNIRQLETQLDFATQTYEKQKNLWEQNIGSEVQFLQLKSQKESLESSLNSLKAQSEKLQIKAPFSGTIDLISAKLGELAAPQLPLLRLINLKSVYIESDLSENYLKAIHIGAKVVLYFSAINKEIEAEVSHIGNYINPSSRSFKIKVNVRNEDQTLKANLLAAIKINDFSKFGLVIPSRLIQEDQKGQVYVYTVSNNENSNVIKRTYIKVEKSFNNLSLVSEGLLESSLLVDKGYRYVTDKEEVKIMP